MWWYSQEFTQLGVHRRLSAHNRGYVGVRCLPLVKVLAMRSMQYGDAGLADNFSRIG